MKKLFLVAMTLLLFHSGYSQQQIPNGDLENWYNVPVSGTLNYDQPGTGPTDNWLATLNELASVPAPIGPGPVTVFKTTDAHGGTYAAKLVSQNFTMFPSDIFIPGMLGTCQMVMTETRALIGRACADCKPVKFTGYFKYEPVSGDSAAAVVLLSKWNTTTKHRDTLGVGFFLIKDAVNEYTKFEIPVYYFTSEVASDSISVLCVASAGFNAVSFTQGRGQVGSTLYIDDLALEYASGISQSLMPEVGVKTYPNPASRMMHVELSKQVRNGVFEMYDASGRQVGSVSCAQLKNIIAVDKLTAGTYYFRLVEGETLLNTGSFTVIK